MKQNLRSFILSGIASIILLGVVVPCLGYPIGQAERSSKSTGVAQRGEISVDSIAGGLNQMTGNASLYLVDGGLYWPNDLPAPIEVHQNGTRVYQSMYTEDNDKGTAGVRVVWPIKGTVYADAVLGNTYGLKVLAKCGVRAASSQAELKKNVDCTAFASAGYGGTEQVSISGGTAGASGTYTFTTQGNVPHPEFQYDTQAQKLYCHQVAHSDIKMNVSVDMYEAHGISIELSWWNTPGIAVGSQQGAAVTWRIVPNENTGIYMPDTPVKQPEHQMNIYNGVDANNLNDRCCGQ